MKKILFLTGTRADYGKLKPLIKSVQDSKIFQCYLFITGMHTLKEFGDTKSEVLADNYNNIHIYINQIIEEPMDLVLANTINGFSRYIRELKPDLILVHGDRVEALAAAISGAINNIIVAHVEGGEVSGTIDESIRHAITKLAHVHFVSNEDSRRRLIQLGELKDSIFVIGSPDIDLILSGSMLHIDRIKQRYEIDFDEYAVVLYHPVTTELEFIENNVSELVDALIQSGLNYVVINPNNDHGYRSIIQEYKRFKNNKKFKVFPSIRFEYFIEILKNSKFIIGNSSVGIHEAPVVGVPTINVGTRQNNRFPYKSIINTNNSNVDIINGIKVALKMIVKPTLHFGNGNSASAFLSILKSERFWSISKQKVFVEINQINEGE